MSNAFVTHKHTHDENFFELFLNLKIKIKNKN